jgi:hypothetical protein
LSQAIPTQVATLVVILLLLPAFHHIEAARGRFDVWDLRDWRGHRNQRRYSNYERDTQDAGLSPQTSGFNAINTSVTSSATNGTVTPLCQICPAFQGSITTSGSMEGNLPINPGDTISAGYDFTLPGTHPADTISATSGSVLLTVNCPDSSTQPLSIALPSQSYDVPANNSQWFPSGDQKSSLVYQGSVTAPTNLCGGQQGHAPKGATFTENFGATTSNKFNVRFHYSDNSAGGWSGTNTVQPTASTCGQ